SSPASKRFLKMGAPILQPLKPGPRRALVYICILSLSSVVFPIPVVHGQSQYFVNPKAVYVDSFEGWGTSLAWWPDVLGHMSEGVIEKVTTSLFSVSFYLISLIRFIKC